MSASNTAHVPMDEPHLSRYGANAARALELEGAVRPGLWPGDAARAGRGGARPAGAGPLGRGERAHAGSGGVAAGQRLSGGAGGADGGAGLPQGQAPAALPERPVCSPVCRPDGALGGPRPGPPPPDGLSLRVPVRTAPHRTGAVLLVPALTWALLCQLRGLCGDLAALQEEQTGPAPLSLSLPGCGPLSDGDWGALLESESRVEAVLRQDPAGCYGSMEDATRRRYRGQVCRLARKRGMGEEETARRVLELSRQGRGRSATWAGFSSAARWGRRKGHGPGRATARWSCSLPPCSPPLWLCCWTAGWGAAALFPPVRSGEKQRGLSSGPSGAPAPGPPHGAGVRHPAGGGGPLRHRGPADRKGERP